MAMSTEDTIPCEHCNNEISVDDWPSHSRQCVNSKERQTENKEKVTIEDPSDGIPCEYCNVQISLDDWESHTNQCANAHKRRIENLRNGINDDGHESMTANIPCEYCGESINLHDWEQHLRSCGNTNNSTTTNRIENNNSTNGSIDALIPCEYCGVQISIHELTWHTKQCADAEKQRIENIARSINNEERNDLIPCEYCGQSFSLKLIQNHEVQCRREQMQLEYQQSGAFEQAFTGGFAFPKEWNQSSPHNLSRYVLETNSDEYKFVEQKFHHSLPSNTILQIERIQNRRWYRQYDAHRDYFIERYGKSTEQWLFHGCKSQSIEAIVSDCFNRSHAVRFAAGQGIYFATEASTSLSYTQPDSDGLRNMFMARVLVGKTTTGNATTRICPPGFDTTGGGTVFVTYHDAQAYGEYLITFR